MPTRGFEGLDSGCWGSDLKDPRPASVGPSSHPQCRLGSACHDVLVKLPASQRQSLSRRTGFRLRLAELLIVPPSCSGHGETIESEIDKAFTVMELLF